MTALARALRVVLRAVEDGTAHRVACDVIDAHGYPTGQGGGVRGGSIADPTALIATDTVDDDRSLVADARRLLALEDDLCRLAAEHARLAVRLSPTVVRDTTPAGVGRCLCCDHYCEGANPTDRLKGGDCHACYQNWLYHQRTHHDLMMPADRQTWRAARRKKLEAEGKLADQVADVVPVRHKREPELVEQVGVGTGGAFTWRDPR